MSLGHLLYCNTEGTDLINLMEPDYTKWENVGETVPKFKDVVEDVYKLLEVK